MTKASIQNIIELKICTGVEIRIRNVKKSAAKEIGFMFLWQFDYSIIQKLITFINGSQKQNLI